VVVERFVYNNKVVKFYNKSKLIMLVWVIFIVCKTLLLNFLGLLYNDNLIKCDTILKF